ncbi:MAG: right-handed parallel beta-helix repeat-containing protein [Deltaproteobacteria bacterium]|nr:right-handed parallel beta-helix repeat-containing protein [Deltaproteobacteria bacterium]
MMRWTWSFAVLLIGLAAGCGDSESPPGPTSSAGGSGGLGGGPGGAAGSGGAAGQGGAATAPCEGVTCSDHGVCVEAQGAPWCVCMRGYHPDGTACAADADPPSGQDWFVATDGDDAAAGTIDDPFRTIRHGLDQVEPGDTVYLRGGVYEVTDRISIRTDGTADETNALWGYPGEEVVIEFSSDTRPCTNTDPGIQLQADYWHLKSLTVRGACYIGIHVSGNHNVIEACVAHDNGDTGIHVGGTSEQTKVLNCDAYRNYDPEEHGQDADGFGAKFDVGPGTEFRGCRAWHNSDDGFDFWEANHPVLVEDCWAFANGIDQWNDPAFEGNGNGFKLGRDNQGGSAAGRHIVVGSVAFGHPANGFDENSNIAGVFVLNNTAWDNGSRDFFFNHGQTATAPNVLRNNLSFSGSVSINAASTTSSNSWEISGLTVDAADFLSLDETLALVDRLPDGSLPDNDLLRLAPGSDCIDAGEVLTEVQRPHTGSAPDLGAFERP